MLTSFLQTDGPSNSILSTTTSNASATILLLALFIAAAGLACQPAELEDFIVASEFDPYPEVQGYLPLLEEHGATLALAVHRARIGDADLADLIREANLQGVELAAWLLLDYADGYWPNEENVELVRELVDEFVTWVDEEGFQVEWIVIDMEMSAQETELLKQLIAEPDLVGLAQLVLGNIDPCSFEQASASYTEMVEELHALGYRVSVVTYPFIMDDMADGDTGIQDAFDVPVSPVPWDDYAFMVYRTLYMEMGLQPGPYLVYDYAKDADRVFGENATIGIGCVGVAGYQDLQVMRDEVAASLAGGVGKVVVYSLDEIMETPDPASWLDVSRPIG